VECNGKYKAVLFCTKSIKKHSKMEQTNFNYSEFSEGKILNDSLQIFQNSLFGEIRVIVEKLEPYFCLQDVCRSLKLSAKKVTQRLSDDVLSKYPISDKLGRKQLTNFVNEDGLYDTVLDSRKPEAKKFRKWLTSEVLPAIRRTGGYIQTAPHDTPEMIMAKALRIANETINNHQQRVQMLEGENQVYREEITKLEPKARYTDEVLQSTSTFTATQMSDHFGISTIKFNNILKEKGIQYSQSGQWHLTSKYKNLDLTEIRIAKYMAGDEIKTKPYLVWTEKGRKFLVELFKSAE